MARPSAIACATASRNWAENSQHSYGMPLPETITMRFTEEDAGYVTVRPVGKQTLRLAEIAASLLKQVLDVSPRALQKKLTARQPPAAMLFFVPRKNSVGAESPP